ncbi:DUF4198 domain-containing protein [Tateyamaria sp. syn59]|uniref:DUF4198 domain-containing protein n=1 Tax=Tateyamaria sp. syn59 TaxID=2576942 RepID=UPI0011BF9909|nr:DUF4198 domain-containing protein [Tateyamaria sp. syn59]
MGAHEFWFEPSASHKATNPSSLMVDVLVGENFAGMVFPFEPRAYQGAYWIGPRQVVALHTRPLSEKTPMLVFQGDGLHTLAVATYATDLEHETVEDFQAFAREIGAGDVLATFPPIPNKDGGVKEKYRRFSKMLIPHGQTEVGDVRHGFEYEWVKSPTGLTLFALNHPAKHHPIDLFCRSSDAKVTYERHVTDADGEVPFLSGKFDRCLANAVFLEASRSGQAWSSTWVSLTWEPKVEKPL